MELPVRRVCMDLYGGLGSRMRPLLSGVRLADDLGVPFEFCWDLYRPPYAIAPYPDLAYPFEVEFEDLWELQYPYKRLSRVEMDQLLYTKPNDVDVRQVHVPFYRAHQTARNCVKPTKEIADRVEQWMDRLERSNKNVIGVTVRSVCSWAPVNHRAPPDWFHARLRELAHDVPNVAFYIASDAKWATRYLARNLGVPVFYQHKPFTYSSPESIKAAVVDIHVLARLDHIVGAAHSVMCRLAHELREDPAQTYEDAITPCAKYAPEQRKRLQHVSTKSNSRRKALAR